jgi:hypothetical protein
MCSRPLPAAWPLPAWPLPAWPSPAWPVAAISLPCPRSNPRLTSLTIGIYPPIPICLSIATLDCSALHYTIGIYPSATVGNGVASAPAADNTC